MLGMEWVWVYFSWVTHFLGCSSNNKGAILSWVYGTLKR